jgi:crotonobetainyl-CoA:carnitine CoA-transferase CaiB-like acyl-CoA transferase
MFIQAGTVDETVITQVGFGSKLMNTPSSIRKLGTIPGADSENILREMGYSANEIKSLINSEIIFN